MQTAIEKVFQIINKDLVVSIFYYGHQPGNDIDLLVIIKDEGFFSRVITDNIDITLVGRMYINFLISVRDPIITEPLLTGKSIFGLTLKNKKHTLLHSALSDQTAPHYLYLINQILFAAEELIDARRYNEALNNVVFAFSYFRFLEHYLSGGSLITLQEILKQKEASLLNEAYGYLKAKIDLRPEKVMSYLLIARQIEKQHKGTI